MTMPTRQNIKISSLSASNIKDNSIVVIVDVYQAFTTAAMALAHGAQSIIMVNDLDEALRLKQLGKGAFCMGERQEVQPYGFDFGNSPTELASCQFNGETIIQTTTNGTRGIIEASSARKIYACSLVTADATARCIRAMDKDIPIELIAMGHLGGKEGPQRQDEDELCALYLRSKILGASPDRNGLYQYLLSLAQSTIPTCTRSEPMTPQDIEHCLRINAFPFAISVERTGEYFTARRENPPV